MSTMFLCITFFVIQSIYADHSKEITWIGGPLHTECDHGPELFAKTGQYVKDNVIAVKAVTFKDNIYLLTPRLKNGVLATIWLLVQGRQGVELQPYPEIKAHSLADCAAIQNAVDFYVDHFGNLWVLDSGIVLTAQQPRCTCPPKVVAISLLWDKVTQHIDLASIVEPTSLLQNIVVEYTIVGKNYVYITDAARGAILVYDISENTGWSLVTCNSSPGLQMALAKHSATHHVLTLVRVPHSGLIELDTAALRRRDALNPVRVFGEHTTPVYLLGSNSNNLYLRLASGLDAFSWDVREAYNETKLDSIHTPVPGLVSTCVFVDNLLHTTLILDTNYGITVNTNSPTYHKLTLK